MSTLALPGPRCRRDGSVASMPHVMFVFPEGTGRILKGLAHDTTSGLPYVRPIPDAEPLLVVPIAKPGERACGCPSECSCGCSGYGAPSRSAVTPAERRR